MVNQRASTWDVIQTHPIAKELDNEAQLALLCEYVDLRDELQGMILADFITAYFAPKAAADTDTDTEIEDEVETPDPTANGDGVAKTKPKPASLIGLRVVYRFPSRNILSNADGVTQDNGKTVSFVDVDDEAWSNVSRDKVHVIDPDNYRTIHVLPREAKEFTGWLAGTPSKDHPDGALLRSLSVEFPESPEITERIIFAIMNGKRPYVDRFVQLHPKGFSDDQKPTTRLFGEHCFRVRDQDYVVAVLSP